MILLGFIYWLYQGGVELEEKLEASKKSELGFLALAAVVMLVIFYQYSIRPLEMLTKTINGQQAAAQGDLAGAVTQYREALSYDTPLDRQSRSSLIQLILSRSDLLSKMDKTQAQAAIDYAIEQGNKNLALNPQDSFTNMIMAELYNLAASFDGDNPQLFSNYSNLAEQTINRTITATPGRIPVYFIKAQIFLSRGEKQQAIEIMKYAVSLNPKYADGQCQLSKTYFYISDSKNGYAALNQCLDLGGATNFEPQELGVYIDYYYKKKDLTRAIELFVQLAVDEPKDPKVWASLAEMYRQNGNKAEAISAANQAATLDPTLKASAAAFIQKVNQ
jgi:tetratricopeptide (TPR) repeat protein